MGVAGFHMDIYWYDTGAYLGFSMSAFPSNIQTSYVPYSWFGSLIKILAQSSF
jgi:hypothetical protein